MTVRCSIGIACFCLLFTPFVYILINSMLGIKARSVGEEVIVYVWVESEQDLSGRSVVKATSKVTLHNTENDGYSFVRRRNGTIASVALEETTDDADDDDYTFDQVKYDEAKKKVEDGLKRLREIGE